MYFSITQSVDSRVNAYMYMYVHVHVNTVFENVAVTNVFCSGDIDFDRYDLTAKTGQAPFGDRMRDLHPLHDALLRHQAKLLRHNHQRPVPDALPRIAVPDEDGPKSRKQSEVKTLFSC